MKRPRGLPGLICTLLAVAWTVCPGQASAAQVAEIDVPAATRKKLDSSDEFFGDRAVRRFEIELSEAELSSLRRSPRSYVRGTVREGQEVLTNVGVRLKGMGSFQSLALKPSFALKFDEFEPDQQYCRLTKLMLNNSIQDRTFLAELLGTQLFRDAGVPSARVTHARVTFNGRDLGLYVALEAMNKRFLKRHFKDSEGNLYEGYLRDIDAVLDQDNGQDTSQADVRSLLAACRIADSGQRFQRLNAELDVDRFVSFAAVEMLIAQWDGYTLHTNNYRLYHDPASGKMVFIAHGLDTAFRRANLSIQPPIKSTVSHALFQTEPGRRLYEQRLRTLATNVFRLETLTNRVEAALARLRAAHLPREELADIEQRAGILCERIVERVHHVRKLLAGTEPALLPFDASGLARLTGWREEFDHGEPALDQLTADGRSLLRIRAQGGRCRASWRTMIFLRPGFYRFEGLVRTEGISRGGAGLRISGDTRNLRISGDNPWRALQHSFAVKEEAGDVELVCEFDAYEGQACYDLSSLRVRKL